MMKKIILFILTIAVSANIFSVYATEEPTDEHIFELCCISKSEYDAFLDNPEDTSVLENNIFSMNITKPTPLIGFEYYSKKVAEALESDVLVDAYVRSKYSDVEIYDKKFVRPEYSLNIFFDVGDFIWLSTNYGIKIIEYRRNKQSSMYNGINDWVEHGDVWFENDAGIKNDVLYYDTVEEYVNKYKNRDVEVYVNGEKVDETYYMEYRNGYPLMSLRFYLEQCGVNVEWSEKYGGMAKYSNDIFTLFSVSEIEYGAATSELMQRHILKIYDDVKAGKYRAYLLPRINKYVPHTIILPVWEGRQLINSNIITYITEMFGKAVSVKAGSDRVDIEIKDVQPPPISDEKVMLYDHNGEYIYLP